MVQTDFQKVLNASQFKDKNLRDYNVNTYDGKILLSGGEFTDGKISTLNEDLYTVSLDGDQVKLNLNDIKQKPGPRKGAMTFVHKDELIISGGYVGDTWGSPLQEAW